MHPTLNKITPDKISYGSKKKVWWWQPAVCSHVWEATPNQRTSRLTGCPYCSNSRTDPERNLSSVFPDLAAQWHSDNPFTADSVSPRSNKSVLWHHEDCGQTWEATVANRTRWSACPFCSGKRVVPGLNDISTTHPGKAVYWDHQKNKEIDVDITNVSYGSQIPVWWTPPCGHSIRTPVKQFVKEKYSCPVCSNKQVVPGVNDCATTHPWKAALLDIEKSSLSAQEFTYGSSIVLPWRCHLGHRWLAPAYSVKSEDTCPSCTSPTSAGEDSLFTFIKSLVGPDAVKRSVRDVIPPYELDVYVPEKRVAIEYNGLYWHSEAHKPNDYHLKKHQAAFAQGIQLIQIWEDDWRDKRGVVEKMLRHKLEHSNQRAVGARECHTETLTYQDTVQFLNENHVQGSRRASFYVGLKDRNGALVAVLVGLVGTSPGAFEISRYATSAKVPGGFSRLLRYAETIFKVKKWTTFADLTVSDGGLYEHNGFTAVHQIAPDYMYVYNKSRYHKSNFRKERFRRDRSLSFESGATESELARLNGIYRVWDAGKIKYEKMVVPSD